MHICDLSTLCISVQSILQSLLMQVKTSQLQIGEVGGELPTARACGKRMGVHTHTHHCVRHCPPARQTVCMGGAASVVHNVLTMRKQPVAANGAGSGPMAGPSSASFSFWPGLSCPVLSAVSCAAQTCWQFGVHRQHGIGYHGIGQACRHSM